jgi:hypothetical protein
MIMTGAVEPACTGVGAAAGAAEGAGVGASSGFGEPQAASSGIRASAVNRPLDIVFLPHSRVLTANLGRMPGRGKS